VIDFFHFRYLLTVLILMLAVKTCKKKKKKHLHVDQVIICALLLSITIAVDWFGYSFEIFT